MRTFRERIKPIVFKERTSVVGSFTPHSKDIFRERIWSPHEEMFECVRMYNENSFAQSAINTMVDFIMGKTITVVSDSKVTQRLGQAYIDHIDMFDFTREVVENSVKTGNGYLETDYSRVTGLRDKFYALADSSRIYINCDQYGQAPFKKELAYVNGELAQMEFRNDAEYYIQSVMPGLNYQNAKWYDMSYMSGYMFKKFRVYGIPIHKDKIIHFRLNLGDTGIYGRSYMASALNDNLVLGEIESSLATIAKYKAVPRDILQYGDKDLPASSDELDDLMVYLESLEKDETALINKPIKREILSYAGQDINLNYMIEHIRKKIIAGICPDFMMGLGDQVNRSTATQQILSYILAIYAKRRLFLKPLTKFILIPWLKKNNLDIKGVELEFGELDFETKSEKESRILQKWNSNILTLNETREEMGLTKLGEKGNVYNIEWQNEMMPDLGGFGFPSSVDEKVAIPCHATEVSLKENGPPSQQEQDKEEKESDYPKNPTGTLLLQRQMAINIRKVFKHKLREVLEGLQKNKTVLEESIRTEATIGFDAVENITGRMFGLSMVVKPIINEFIKKSYLRGNSITAQKLKVGKFVPFDKRHLEALQKNTFEYVRKFSDEQKGKLREILTEGVSQGDSISIISNQIKEAFKVVSHRSELIAKTEIIRSYNEAVVQSVRDSGVTKEVRYITAHDCRVCNQCKPLNNKVFKLSQLKKGVNKPPLHPQCLIDGQIPVLTSKGWKKIREIKIGDLVLTHKGKFKNVEKVLKNQHYKGEVYSVYYGYSKNKNRKSTLRKISFTPEHPILTSRGWVLVKDLKNTDELIFKGKRCKNCNTLFPELYESRNSEFCSVNCGAAYTAKEQFKDIKQHEIRSVKAKEQMIREYKNGSRDRFKITKKMNDKVRELISKGLFHAQQNKNKKYEEIYGKERGELIKKKMSNTIKQSEYHKNGTWIKGLNKSNSKKIRNMTKKRNEFFLKHPEKHPNMIMAKKALRGFCGYISKPQMEMYNLIKEEFKDAILEYPLKIKKDGKYVKYRYLDIGIPSLKLDCEYDGAYWHTKEGQKSIDRDNKRDSEIKSMNWIPLHYSKNNYKDCLKEIKAIVMNHNNEYEFITVPIIKLKKWMLKQKKKLYNFAVKDDESYIVKGMVTHNCRCDLVPHIKIN